MKQYKSKQEKRYQYEETEHIIMLRTFKNEKQILAYCSIGFRQAIMIQYNNISFLCLTYEQKS